MVSFAIIPLRAGSQSLPRKNIRPLAGRPLCDWVIQSCIACDIFDGVWVSTDDDEIAEIARRSGALVHQRAPETATATASSESALIDFANSHPSFDSIALVQATSPLTRPEHLMEAWRLFQSQRADSLVTVARQHKFRWEGDGRAVNYNPARRPRRQDWDGELVENGAFYFTRKETLFGSGCRLGGKVVVYEMPAYTAYEIDEPADWLILERLASRYGFHPVAPKIKLAVFDVDGVLTDAGFYYSETGEALKKFNTRDGAGISTLKSAGVELGIITGESTGFAPARANKLGIKRIELGCSEKLPILDAWREELGLRWDEVVYMGDDLPDLPCIQACGIGACPSDAEPEIVSAARFVSTQPGGQGAVRDLVRHLISTQRI